MRSGVVWVSSVQTVHDCFLKFFHYFHASASFTLNWVHKSVTWMAKKNQKSKGLHFWLAVYLYSSSPMWDASKSIIAAIVNKSITFAFPFEAEIADEMGLTRKGGTGTKFLGLNFWVVLNTRRASISSTAVAFKMLVTVGTTWTANDGFLKSFSVSGAIVVLAIDWETPMMKPASFSFSKESHRILWNDRKDSTPHSKIIPPWRLSLRVSLLLPCNRLPKGKSRKLRIAVPCSPYRLKCYFPLNQTKLSKKGD